METKYAYIYKRYAIQFVSSYENSIDTNCVFRNSVRSFPMTYKILQQGLWVSLFEDKALCLYKYEHAQI